MKKADQMEHRDRKNPKSAEAFAQKRKETNALRPKQVWNNELKVWDGR